MTCRRRGRTSQPIYAMIENLDANIGRLLERVRAAPGFEDTLTVYFSDHGDYMGSHGVFNTKEHPHEESVRIPAIFHWPGHIHEGMFSLVDLLATTLELVGSAVPVWSQGRDFSPDASGRLTIQPAHRGPARDGWFSAVAVEHARLERSCLRTVEVCFH